MPRMATIGPLVTTPKPDAQDDSLCPTPEGDVQEARILFRNAALVKHLRAHPLGDWVKNPHRCEDADAIKGVICEWLRTTPAGKRLLVAADVGEDELSIDRLVTPWEDGVRGLSCIHNLYLMPVQHSAYLGPGMTAAKRAYVGELAYQLAKKAHDIADCLEEPEGLVEGGNVDEHVCLVLSKSRKRAHDEVNEEDDDEEDDEEEDDEEEEDD